MLGAIETIILSGIGWKLFAMAVGRKKADLLAALREGSRGKPAGGDRSEMPDGLEWPGFIHLRTHSAYSLLEGALPIKTMLKLAAVDDQPALAISDTNNLFGALEFSVKAMEEGIQPIIACQSISTWKTMMVKTAARRITSNGRNPLY